MKNQKNLKYILFLAFALILCGCCSQYSRGELKKKKNIPNNPTEHIFNTSITKVVEILNRDNIYWSDIFEKPDEDVMNEWRFSLSDYDTKIILNESGDDTIKIHFKHFNHSFIGKSYTYYTEKGPLNFRGTFCLDLEKIDNQKTKVRVKIEDMSVLIGRYFNMHCWCCAYDETIVEPSGVEEYKFLYRIGKILGDFNMPDPRYPN